MRVADELPAAPVAAALERLARWRLLRVEEDQVDRWPGKRRSKVPRQLEQDGDARGPVVSAHEARNVLGVVVRPRDDRARFGSGDARDDVTERALDAHI